jgi:2-isopropylmalate synthase
MNSKLEVVEVFDTTLRDGLQVEGVSATVDDKLRIAEQLDYLGVHYIEGGWPGANPKDIEFFARANAELRLTTSTMVAFGSTRRPKGKVDDDTTLRNLLDANTSAVCIVAKSWDYHVLEALQTTLDEGEAMIADSVAYLHGARPPGDGGHGALLRRLQAQPRVRLRALEAAIVKGASHVVLCDTNGGSLPHEVEAIVGDVYRHVGNDVIIGIHCHDDTGCAVANSMAAVRAGGRHVQGTLNGLGERTGNCNLTTVIPNLQLKLGRSACPRGASSGSLRSATTSPRCSTARSTRRRPTWGRRRSPTRRACTSAPSSGRRTPTSTSTPSLVGNGTRFVVSEMAGRATIQIKAEELGLPLDGPAVNQVIDDLKRLEHEGYHFEAADASLELLMRRAGGWEHRLPGREHARHHRRTAQRRVHHRGHGEGVGGRRRRRRAPRAHRRGQRPGQRDRHRLRTALRGVPAARPRAPHRLQGAHPRRGHRHRRRHAGAHRLHQRQAQLDHHRRQQQHHRGLLAGARRRLVSSCTA